MITSNSNQQMKRIVQLQKKSKTRWEQRVFVVEGPKMVLEAPPDRIEGVYVSESFLESSLHRQRLLKHLLEAGCGYEVVSDSVMHAISDTKTPQGILALVKMPSYELGDMIGQMAGTGGSPVCERDAGQIAAGVGESLACEEAANRRESAPIEKPPHILVLESIQDPGNLGTMLRTGEGAGISGVLMNDTTADIYHPKTIRATMGSVYRVPCVITEDLRGAVLQLKTAGITVYAAHLKGRAAYDEPDYTGGCAFLIGNEGNGLTDEMAALADAYIRIPMEGQVESLNAAIAATLLMYEASRQRRRGT